MKSSNLLLVSLDIVLVLLTSKRTTAECRFLFSASENLIMTRSSWRLAAKAELLVIIQQRGNRQATTSRSWRVSAVWDENSGYTLSFPDLSIMVTRKNTNVYMIFRRGRTLFQKMILKLKRNHINTNAKMLFSSYGCQKISIWFSLNTIKLGNTNILGLQSTVDLHDFWYETIEDKWFPLLHF